MSKCGHGPSKVDLRKFHLKGVDMVCDCGEVDNHMAVHALNECVLSKRSEARMKLGAKASTLHTHRKHYHKKGRGGIKEETSSTESESDAEE